jgi:hypothetical protein
MKFTRPFGKSASQHRGFLLLESAMSLSILTVLSLVLLRLSLNALQPRQWTMIQTLTDAYMDREQAWAQRIPFDMIAAPATAPVGQPTWPPGPAPAAAIPNVVIGRLPNTAVGVPGRNITANVARTSRAILAPGAASNTAGMTVYQLQSVMTYSVPNQPGSTYVKARTVIRSE